MALALMILKAVCLLLAALLALILIIIILALCIPVSYNVVSAKNEGMFLNAAVSYGVVRYRSQIKDGLSRNELRVLGRRIGQSQTTTGKKSTKKNKERKSRKQSGNENNPGTILRQIISYPEKKKLINITIKMIKRLLRPLKPKLFNAEGTIGFDDPSYTGYFVGMAEALRGIYDLGKTIRIQGDFQRKILYYKFNVKGWFIPLSLIWPVLAYVFSGPIMRIIRDSFLKKRG